MFGLSVYTTEREIKRLFEKYGEVDTCQIVFDHGSGRSRGFGFVNMKSVKDAERAKVKVRNLLLRVQLISIIAVR